MIFTELISIIGNSDFLIAFCIAIVAGFMRGFVGVGSGMLMAPVYAILFGPLETVIMIIIMELVVTFQMLPSVHHLIEWTAIIPMSIAAAVFMPVGTWLLITVDVEIMSRGIATVVLLFVIILMSGWRYQGPKRLRFTIGVGSLSGALMAATSLGNPPVILYLLSGSDSAASNRANFTGYFLLTLIILLSMMIVKDLMLTSAIIRAIALLPVFILGAWIGARYFQKASDKIYRQVALCLLLCVAVFGVIR